MHLCSWSSDRFDIQKAPRSHCCRGACQISWKCSSYTSQPHGFGSYEKTTYGMLKQHPIIPCNSHVPQETIRCWQVGQVFSAWRKFNTQSAARSRKVSSAMLDSEKFCCVLLCFIVVKLCTLVNVCDKKYTHIFHDRLFHWHCGSRIKSRRVYLKCTKTDMIFFSVLLALWGDKPSVTTGFNS